ncbi:hypothetical protein V6N13_038663 [Hibiscus sabdariffa]
MSVRLHSPRAARYRKRVEQATKSQPQGLHSLEEDLRNRQVPSVVTGDKTMQRQCQGMLGIGEVKLKLTKLPMAVVRPIEREPRPVGVSWATGRGHRSAQTRRPLCECQCHSHEGLKAWPNHHRNPHETKKTTKPR